MPCLKPTHRRLPAATCAALLTSALTISPTTGLSAGQIARNAFAINQFENNGGLFAYNTREYLISGRLDHTFSDKDQIFFRFSYGHDREQNTDVQSLIGFSRGSSIFDRDVTLQGAWFHQFSARTQNEFRLQGNDYKFNVTPNVPGQVGLDVPGFGNFGTNIFLPSNTTSFHPEAADNLTLIRGHHTIKLGAYELIRDNHTESHTFFPGRFVFGNLPGGVLSPCLQVPAASPDLCGLTAATIDPLHAVSLGAPQFYQQGFGDPVNNYTRPWTAFYGQDSWQIGSSLTLNYGLRYELDSQVGPINTDRNNFAPRVSFAWDPFKDRKTVIRGGWGVFNSQIYGQITNVIMTLGNTSGVRQIAQVFVPLTGAPGNPALTSAVIFQTLFAQNVVQCTTPAVGQAACITPATLAQFGIGITHTGAVPPLTVLFSAQPNYKNPDSMQGEVGIEREIGGGFSVGASYIYVRTRNLPIAIDQNLKPAPFVVSSSGTAIRQWSNATTGCPVLTVRASVCGRGRLQLFCESTAPAGQRLLVRRFR